MGRRRSKRIGKVFYTEFSKAHDPRLQERLVAQIRKLKEETPCPDCHQFFPYYVMDFDHVRGKKKFNISAATRYVWPAKVPVIMREIEKCELVCSNCHRIRTHRRFEMAKKFA